MLTTTQTPQQRRQTTLIRERRYLPPSLNTWRKRVQLLSDNLRKTTPCRDAMRTRATGRSTWNGYCIDGAITLTAERHGIVRGQWVVSDYSAHPETEEMPMAPRIISPDGTRLMTATPGTFSSVTKYEYHIPRHHADSDRPYPSQTPNAPAEARLWLGLDATTPTGAHPEFLCNNLPAEALIHAQETYGVRFPDAASLPRLNDIIYAQGINPLPVIADLLEKSTANAVHGLWHPSILAIIRRETPACSSAEK